jgi:hypothetical protein
MKDERGRMKEKTGLLHPSSFILSRRSVPGAPWRIADLRRGWPSAGRTSLGATRL